MLEKLMDSPIAWAVLSILTIVSFVYAIITQHINKEKKEFSYIQKSNTLLHKKKGKFDKLSVSYNGQEIEDLCVSRFTIWNSGNKTLNENDMVTSKELTVTALGDNKILDVELIVCSEETNNFFTQIIDEHTVKIFFEYADKKDGAVIQIIHTGTDKSLKIECKIKGGKPIKNFVNETVPNAIRKYVRQDLLDKITVVISCIMMIFLFFMAVASTIAIFNTDLQHILFVSKEANKTQPFEPQNTAIIMSIIFWVYGLLLSALFIPTFKKKFDIGIPKALKKHSGFED